jgi:hypothetical protein
MPSGGHTAGDQSEYVNEVHVGETGSLPSPSPPPQALKASSDGRMSMTPTRFMVPPKVAE